MRDIALVSGLLVLLGITLRYPYAGVLTWGWMTLMNPHMMVYSFARGAPLNFAVALVTVVSFLMSREKLRWPRDPLPYLMVAFVAWMTFNSFFAADPDWSWPLWDRTIRIYAFIFLALATMTSKARLHAMVWVIVISIGYYGVKGGVFTLMSGGNFRVYGPENTIIGDNNQLAAAIVMILPLVYYLMQHTENKWLRLGFKLSFPLQIATVLGSYSRGGVIALSVMLSLFWLRSRRKVTYFIMGALLVWGTFQFMPAEFFGRMSSVGDASTDQSFIGRVNAWQVSYHYAVDHFPFGAGYAGTQRKQVFNYYFPDTDTHAAHSIYFQVLGEHGFPGLFLYLLIAVQALYNTRIVLRRCRGRPELAWARDLATMTEVALIGFYVGGAALSMAYYDGFLLLQAFTSILRQQTEPDRKTYGMARRMAQNPATPAAEQVADSRLPGESVSR
ncbi:MAG: putative O-glycosylation ligase, exosortase A system-associated [Telmatospirillum sp.]|nr:putative O-glycosylation ligase, exosortase A system-associated [Telmatospirillum sp.]